MVLAGDVSAVTVPGQFINIALDGRYLRRPISVCDFSADSVTILYKVVGGGTEQMATLPIGTALDVLTGLGNGFDISAAGARNLLIGGGIGSAPLYRLAKDLISEGKTVTCVLGFNGLADVFYADAFRALGADVIVTTVDGSVGVEGFVTDAVAGLCYDYFYTCGPESMLRAVYRTVTTDGQFSFEERMGCGFGACMGCSCKTVTGYKRICKDGPVLGKGELLWED